MALNGRNAGHANGVAGCDPRLDRLYHEAARELPPAHLDAPILAAARREVGARPRSFAWMLRRWHIPASIAAVVIVSVSLAILVREEQTERIEEVPVPAAATPAEQAAALRTQPTPAETTRETAQPRVAAPAPQRQELRDDVGLSAALGKRADSARTESGGPSPPSGVAAVATPAPAAKPAPQPFVAAPPRGGEEREAPVPADTVTAGRLASTPAAPSEPMAAPAADDAQRAKPMARAMAAKTAEQDRPRVWEGFEKEPPEKWLARIQELKRQGRSVEAEEMLSEFKRRFPQQPRP